MPNVKAPGVGRGLGQATSRKKSPEAPGPTQQPRTRCAGRPPGCWPPCLAPAAPGLLGSHMVPSVPRVGSAEEPFATTSRLFFQTTILSLFSFS